MDGSFPHHFSPLTSWTNINHNHLLYIDQIYSGVIQTRCEALASNGGTVRFPHWCGHDTTGRFSW